MDTKKRHPMYNKVLNVLWNLRGYYRMDNKKGFIEILEEYKNLMLDWNRNNNHDYYTELPKFIELILKYIRESKDKTLPKNIQSIKQHFEIFTICLLYRIWVNPNFDIEG